MNRRTVYLSLCIVGTILPYWQFVPWIIEHGLNAQLFFENLFANRISVFFATDVFVSAAVVFAFVAFEWRQLGTRWWVPVMAVMIVGVSLGLPLLLYLREGKATS